uniref:C2H2-type domain-containing protein n=1 Tax=Macrostomum lignano TaxID=282301 RepID=A0A1I8JRA4_9PLAT
VLQQAGRLLLHNSSVHKADPRPFQLRHLRRQFSTSAYLSQHRRIHSGQKPYGCKYCDKRFTQLSHVQQHERIHTGDKPYRCWQCAKKAISSQHMKDKPHRCEPATCALTPKDELDTHAAAKHSTNRLAGTARYSSGRVCGKEKNYNSETYLNKHLAKHKDPTQVVTDRAAAKV